MLHKAFNPQDSNTLHPRCQHHTAKGRQCRTQLTSSHPTLCTRHARLARERQRDDSADLSARSSPTFPKKNPPPTSTLSFGIFPSPSSKAASPHAVPPYWPTSIAFCSVHSPPSKNNNPPATTASTSPTSPAHSASSSACPAPSATARCRRATHHRSSPRIPLQIHPRHRRQDSTASIPPIRRHAPKRPTRHPSARGNPFPFPLPTRLTSSQLPYRRSFPPLPLATAAKPRTLQRSKRKPPHVPWFAALCCVILWTSVKLAPSLGHLVGA